MPIDEGCGLGVKEREPNVIGITGTRTKEGKVERIWSECLIWPRELAG